MIPNTPANSKIISIRQPWAWAIVIGIKPVENRTWTTSYRGELYIHAPKNMDYDGVEWLESRGIIVPDELDVGGIIGKTNLVDVVTSCDSDYFTGPFGLIMKDSETVPFVEMKGRLGIFNWR